MLAKSSFSISLLMHASLWPLVHEWGKLRIGYKGFPTKLVAQLAPFNLIGPSTKNDQLFDYMNSTYAALLLQNYRKLPRFHDDFTILNRIKISTKDEILDRLKVFYINFRNFVLFPNLFL